MSRLALISQTLRADYCQAYMNDDPVEGAVLTARPAAFTELEFSAQTRVIAVNPPPELLPARHITQDRVFRSFLRQARSGSRLGPWLERAAKWFARHLRQLRAPLRLRRRPPGQEINEGSIRTSAMYAKLLEEHNSRAIDQLVVFDVFDLPVALTFAEDHQIELLVR